MLLLHSLILYQKLFIIMKIPNKSEFQQTAYNHSPDISSEDCKTIFFFSD